VVGSPSTPLASLRCPPRTVAATASPRPRKRPRLLAALPDGDRAVWATAVYGGLRRGELQALRARDVRLEEGVIAVEAGWGEKDGRIPPKGRRTRRVPIPSVLREILVGELLRTGRRGDDLVFGSTEHSPFSPTRLTARARKAWKAAGLSRITLHECRHSFASLIIVAGVNAKALSDYIGHASIQITFDRYG
jgi:integrase